jgi:hypothetical protein
VSDIDWDEYVFIGFLVLTAPIWGPLFVLGFLATRAIQWFDRRWKKNRREAGWWKKNRREAGW